MIICDDIIGFKYYLYGGNLNLSGTGSNPEPPHGLHLKILQTARAKPRTGPNFSNACRAYSEHVGVKRHDGGVYGVIHF